MVPGKGTGQRCSRGTRALARSPDGPRVPARSARMPADAFGAPPRPPRLPFPGLGAPGTRLPADSRGEAPRTLPRAAPLPLALRSRSCPSGATQQRPSLCLTPRAAPAQRSWTPTPPGQGHLLAQGGCPLGPLPMVRGAPAAAWGPSSQAWVSPCSPTPSVWLRQDLRCQRSSRISCKGACGPFPLSHSRPFRPCSVALAAPKAIKRSYSVWSVCRSA